MSAFLTLAWSFLRSPVGRALASFLAAAAILMGFYWWAWSRGVQHEAPKVEAAQEAARTATAQTGVTTAAAAAADTASTVGQKAQAQAEEASHEVQASADAGRPLDAPGLAVWRAERKRVLDTRKPDRAGR